ncbi:hypothetical protein TruAng_005893 [Truncatella angustata]|nr:hypothetical protein TruAng_005893 [Truncatella angustata]
MGAFMSYEVQGYCRNHNISLDCKTQFGGTNVTSFGGIERGDFEPDPDIAGMGVLLAFLIPESIVLLFGFFVVFARTYYIWDPELSRPTMNSWFVRRIARSFSSSQESKYEERMMTSSEILNTEGGDWDPPYPIGLPTQGGTTNGSSSALPSVYSGTTHGYAFGDQAIPMSGPLHQTTVPAQPQSFRPPTRRLQRRGFFWRMRHVVIHRVAAWIDDTMFGPFKSNITEVALSEKKNGEKLYEFFEVAVLAVSDTQLLLGIAQVVSFGLLGRCETSRYHATIGMYMVLLASWSALLAMVLVRCYWKAPLAALTRIVACVVLALFLAYLYEKQLRYGKTTPHQPLWGRRDSLIFLAGSCFLDPDLWKETFDSLSQGQLNAVGWSDPKTSPDFIAYVSLCACAAFVLPVLLVRFCRDLAGVEDGSVKRINNRFYQFFVTVYWVLPLVMAMVVYVYSAWTIFNIRRWVHASGWMSASDGAKAEDNVHGLGQIAPIVATCAVIIAICDKWEKLPRIKEH